MATTAERLEAHHIINVRYREGNIENILMCAIIFCAMNQKSCRRKMLNINESDAHFACYYDCEMGEADICKCYGQFRDALLYLLELFDYALNFTFNILL